MLLFLFALLTGVSGQGITETPITIFTLRDANFRSSPLIPQPELVHYDGPVINTVNVVSVLFGAPGSVWGSYDSALTSGSMDQYYRELTKSVYIEWLIEYSIPDQSITEGVFTGRYSINPTTITLNLPLGGILGNDVIVVTDANIQQELQTRIDSGDLPQPQKDEHGNTRTVYMVHFPSNVQITSNKGLISCVAYCGYHGSFESDSQVIAYAVLPDVRQGACDGGCGDGSTSNNQRVVASHELAEAITDTRVSEWVATNSEMVGWYSRLYGEISDICLGQNDTLRSNGITLTVQRLWSNQDSACITSKDFLVSTAQSTISLSANQGVEVPIVLTQLGGSTQSVSFVVVSSLDGVISMFGDVSRLNEGTIQLSVQTSDNPTSGDIHIRAIGTIYTKEVVITLNVVS